MKATPVLFAFVLSCIVSGAVLADGDNPQLAPTGNNDLTRTGGGTLTRTGGGTLAADPSSPAFTITAASDVLSGAGTVTVTLDAPANASAAPEANGAYDIPLTTSDENCTVPDFVTLNWSSDKGGSASFDVTCKAASAAHLVTVTAGNAAIGFLLKP